MNDARRRPFKHSPRGPQPRPSRRNGSPIGRSPARFAPFSHTKDRQVSRDPFLSGPVGIPGAWGYKLKEVVSALGTHEADYRVGWPGDLAEGLRAMVMGWRAYQAANPLDTPEMRTLTAYLETDCKALWTILRWLRAGA